MTIQYNYILRGRSGNRNTVILKCYLELLLQKEGTSMVRGVSNVSSYCLGRDVKWTTPAWSMSRSWDVQDTMKTFLMVNNSLRVVVGIPLRFEGNDVRLDYYVCPPLQDRTYDVRGPLFSLRPVMCSLGVCEKPRVYDSSTDPNWEQFA